MKQYEAVIEVMKANGGYSTLGNLYQEVFKIENKLILRFFCFYWFS